MELLNELTPVLKYTFFWWAALGIPTGLLMTLIFAVESQVKSPEEAFDTLKEGMLTGVVFPLAWFFLLTVVIPDIIQELMTKGKSK
jgi:hypothetical protein